MANPNVDDEIVDDVVVDDQEDDQDKGKDPYADLTPEQLKERLSKAEKAIVKSKRTEAKPITKQPDGDKPDWAKDAELRETKRDFAEEHNLSKKQTEAVFRYNGGAAPDEETLASPEVQAMIKALGSKDRVAANTPRGGNAPVYKGKTFAEVTSDKASSKDDKKGAFDAVRKKHGIA